MCGAREEAREVRDEEAHEAHGAAHRHGAGDEERRGGEQREAQASRIEAV